MPNVQNSSFSFAHLLQTLSVMHLHRIYLILTENLTVLMDISVVCSPTDVAGYVVQKSGPRTRCTLRVGLTKRNILQDFWDEASGTFSAQHSLGVDWSNYTATPSSGCDTHSVLRGYCLSDKNAYYLCPKIEDLQSYFYH